MKPTIFRLAPHKHLLGTYYWLITDGQLKIRGACGEPLASVTDRWERFIGRPSDGFAVVEGITTPAELFAWLSTAYQLNALGAMKAAAKQNGFDLAPAFEIGGEG